MKDDVNWQEKYLDSQVEISRLCGLITDLQDQLRQALEGNKELRELLQSLQSKLDVLIGQSKKRKKKGFRKATTNSKHSWAVADNLHSSEKSHQPKQTSH